MVNKNGFVKIGLKDYGDQIYDLIKELYPICRSITGNGVRETLDIIKKEIPIKIHEVPSGTKVFDWKIPKEWNIFDAYIKDSKGNKIIDFKKSNLHVLNYSIPIKKMISFNELKDHLHTLPKHPDWIPYLTSYYNEEWGFCLSQKQFDQMNEENYEICIDSSLEDGYLTYAELFIQGEINDEILLSCYVCHPSMCNDNLSGVAIITFLAKILKEYKTKYSYRFLFIPETIGAISWLSINENNIQNLKYGLVSTCVGDSGHSTYKKTKQGNSYLDKIVEKVLIDCKDNYEIIDFFPWGSDERQFSSLGFNIPVGSLMRTPYAHKDFPQYHTSADNLEFMNKKALNDSLMKYLKIIHVFENDETYLNLNSKCEPQLGKRGLYQLTGGIKNQEIGKKAILWMLNLSDGKKSLLDISIISNIDFETILNSSKLLFDSQLLKKIEKDIE